MIVLTHEEREQILDNKSEGYNSLHDCGSKEIEGDHEDNGYFWYDCIFTSDKHPGQLFCFEYLYSNEGGLNHIDMMDIYEVTELVETITTTVTTYPKVT